MIMGYVGWMVIIVSVVAWRRGRRRVEPTARRASPVVGGRADAVPDRGGNAITGWVIGHHIAHGQHGFPGDPLPGGHLGRPADLAFWGSTMDCDGDDVLD
jgi:hypothetical protein